MSSAGDMSGAAVGVVSPPRRVPGRLELLAAQRQARDLELASRPAGHPLGFVFDAESGNRAIEFLEGYCRHHKGEWAGRPLLLEDWQKDIIRQAFGWKRRDGSRRFRICYWEIPRKNGKSEIASGLALYLTIADHEPGAEVYSSATKKDQARIVFDTACEMVRKSPELGKFARVLTANISISKTGSKFEPLGADSDTLDGLNPHGNVVDELHAHKDRGLWDVLDTAMGARRQPMTLAITTAGTFTPESIGWQQHEHAIKVLEGVIDDEYFHAAIFTCDEPSEEDRGYYFTEQAWRQANPNYGVSVKPEYMANQAKKAKDQPSFFNTFLRLHMNVWTRTTKRWLDVEQWNKSDPVNSLRAREVATARELALKGRRCFGGLDLSSKIDLSALVLVFPGPDETIDLVSRFWMPKGTIDAEFQKGDEFWSQWAAEGWLTETPGAVIDYERIEAEAMRFASFYDLAELAYDPWSATSSATKLIGEGMPMIEFGQGYKSMSEPSKEFEKRIVSAKVRHAGNPVLRYCVSNVAKTEDAAGNYKPDKSESRGRIDGVIASIMGLGRLIVQPKQKESVYETRGLRQL